MVRAEVEMTLKEHTSINKNIFKALLIGACAHGRGMIFRCSPKSRVEALSISNATRRQASERVHDMHMRYDFIASGSFISLSLKSESEMIPAALMSRQMVCFRFLSHRNCQSNQRAYIVQSH